MAGQDLSLRLAHQTLPFDRLLIPHHDGERLDRTGLSGPEFRYRLFIRRVTAKVKTADSLDRHNAAFENGPAGGRDGIPSYDLRPDPSPGSLYRLVRFFKVFPVSCPVLILLR